MNKPLSKIFAQYKAAYSGHPKEIWALAILTFINRSGTMVLPFLAVYLTTVLDFSLKEAGILAGAFGFGSFAGSYLGGRFSDRFGANVVIINSLFFSGVLFILLQFAVTFYSLYFFIFITALFGEAYRPAVAASVGDYVPKSQTGRTMSLLRLAINLGMSAAPAFGGFLAASLGYKFLFWIDGLTCIAGAVYFWNVSRKWEKRTTVADNMPDAESKIPAIAPYKNRYYLLFLFATFLMGFGFIQWFHSVPVFIKTEWGFDERYIGILMATNSILISLFEMPAIHSIEKAKKIKVSMLAGLILLGLSFLPFLLTKALVFCFIAVLLFTLGEMFFLPLNTSIALNMSPLAKRGEYMSWYWMTWSLANIAGPTLGLAFVDQFGFSLFWICLSLLVGVSLLLNLGLADRIIP